MIRFRRNSKASTKVGRSPTVALLVGAVRHVTMYDFTSCARCLQISMPVGVGKKDARLTELMDAKVLVHLIPRPCLFRASRH